MMNEHWIQPDWPAPPGVNAVFTTRHGGLSPAPFDSLNLGDHVGDAPVWVASNRALLTQAIGGRVSFLQQVHGAAVAPLHTHSPDGTVADACLTTDRQVACTILVADCLPVLLATRCGAVVGAAHAGWRGLAGAAARAPAEGEVSDASVDVLTAFVTSFRAAAQEIPGCDAADLIAWLGPCIGPDAFEVGADVPAAFRASLPDSADCFQPTAGGKWLADLPALARRRLLALGLNPAHIHGNDGSPDWCTVTNPSRFFSHRRDAAVGPGGNGRGTTGRMAACIWRD